MLGPETRRPGDTDGARAPTTRAPGHARRASTLQGALLGRRRRGSARERGQKGKGHAAHAPLGAFHGLAWSGRTPPRTPTEGDAVPPLAN